MMFTKATRKKAKLRLGIVGPSGSGKTYSALLIAKGIGGKIAVVDTENHSSELYAGSKGMPEYDVCMIAPPYTVEKYIAAIEGAEKAGYDVVILDSISHAWAGEGGLLDQHGRIADSGKANSFAAWRTVTPKHNNFIEKMLSCNLHLIATMRSKVEYAIVQNEKGKAEPKKIGLAPIQREGMDYEFTTVFDIDTHHNVMASKDRTNLFDGKIFTPTEATGAEMITWLESGQEIEAVDKKTEATEASAKTSALPPVPPSQVNPDDIPEPENLSNSVEMPPEPPPKISPGHKRVLTALMKKEGVIMAVDQVALFEFGMCNFDTAEQAMKFVNQFPAVLKAWKASKEVAA